MESGSKPNTMVGSDMLLQFQRPVQVHKQTNLSWKQTDCSILIFQPQPTVVM